MEERIRKEIEHLASMRESVLDNYLDSLVSFTPEKGNIDSATCAGILHDLDRHITNLEMELGLIKAHKQVEFQFGGVSHG